MSDDNNNILPENKPTSGPGAGKGGWRPGAGRPKGSTNRLTAASLLRTIELKAGKTFEELLTEGYLDSIVVNDKKLRVKYETLIIGKVMSDIVETNAVEAMTKEDIEKRISELIDHERHERSEEINIAKNKEDPDANSTAN